MNPFLWHFQRTRHLCVYQYQYLKTCPLPTTLFFPYVTTLTLIDCSRRGVSHLLFPERFPQLKEIRYLSGHPGIYNIYERFPKSVSWVFPNRDYAFYNCMVEAGIGKKNNDLILSYIMGQKVKDNMTYFDIHVPGYGHTDGNFYQSHMHHYFQNPHVITTLSSNELVPKNENDEQHHLHYLRRTAHPIQLYERYLLEQAFFAHIMKDS
jgi:hypothetical protein